MQDSDSYYKKLSRRQYMATIANIDNLDTIIDEMDFDYSVGEVHIATVREFREHLLLPSLDPGVKRFYRGERIVSLSRPLLPTMFRDRNALIGDHQVYGDIDSDFILNYYKSIGHYYDLFTSAFGQARKYCLYDICAFSQHYMNWSPLIDFTKSLHVALSFGLKGKHNFEDHGLLYVVEITDPENYTQDRVTAECWLNDYHVRVYSETARKEHPQDIVYKAPEGKIIDIATNDRMKFQQGVFLLLNNFTLVNHLYLTKNVRGCLNITKYILDKELCPELTALIEQDAPWYSFSNLLDLSAGLQTAIRYHRSGL